MPNPPGRPRMSEAEKLETQGRGKRLTVKQTAFCEAYATNGGLLIAAYRQAYPACTMSDADACAKANVLLSRPHVQAYLAWLAERTNSRLIQQHDASVDRIATELCRVAFADPVDLFAADGSLLALQDMPEGLRRAVSTVKVRHEQSPTTGLPVQISEIRFWDKLGALNTLAKWKKMLIDRSEVGRPGEFDGLTDADLERELAALEARDVILRARTTHKRKAIADGGS